MHKLPTLHPGDTVEIIAPGFRCTDQKLTNLQKLLTSWQLNCITAEDIFGDDFLCAHTDQNRFNSLKNALENSDVKAIICSRGGYGSMRLIPALSQMTPPDSPKILLGMSDITALHLFLERQWQWPSIHAGLAIDLFSPESHEKNKSVLFNEHEQIEFQATPLNKAAENNLTINSTITGGNLTLVQTSIGTNWQINADNKIVFFEDTGERGYRIDRMLEQLRQVGIFRNARAIVFGDFIKGEELSGKALVQPVLKRFAECCDLPVVQIEGIGHGYINFPLLLGTPAKLNLGEGSRLLCYR